MMMWLQDLGLWNWLLIGLTLIGLELLIPGVFIIWFGFGAIATAFICALLSPSLPFFGFWQIQIGLFSLFSIAFVLIGRDLSRRYKRQSDVSFLNRRTDAMLGQTATLEEPIKNGQGRIRFGDTLWRVNGPDLPAGRSVKLVKFHNGSFLVEDIADS